MHPVALVGLRSNLKGAVGNVLPFILDGSDILGGPFAPALNLISYIYHDGVCLSWPDGQRKIIKSFLGNYSGSRRHQVKVLGTGWESNITF